MMYNYSPVSLNGPYGEIYAIGSLSTFLFRAAGTEPASAEIIPGGGTLDLATRLGAIAGTGHAEGINSKGEIVGSYNDAVGRQYGFLKSGETYFQINPFKGQGIDGENLVGLTADGRQVLGVLTTSAVDISSNGVVVGNYVSKLDGETHERSFTYKDGAYKIFKIDGAADIHSTGINSFGQTVGVATIAGKEHAFVRDDSGAVRLIDTISDSINATKITPQGINDLGQVAGYYVGADGKDHGFIYFGGSAKSIEFPNAYETRIYGIDNAGDVAGSYHDSSYLVKNSIGTHAFTGSIANPITVANTATTVAGGTATGTAGQFGSGILADDVDPNGLFLSIVAVTGGSVGSSIAGKYGHLKLNADGSFVYNADNAAAIGAGPSANNPLHDTFTYTVANALGGKADSTLDLKLENVSAVYRFFDTKTQDHFYSTSAAEKSSIQTTLPNYRYEGIGWATPDKGAGTTDVFRFFDSKTGTHFFTTSTAERDSIVKTLPTYKYEGVAFQAYAGSDGSDPGVVFLERFFNTKTQLHHYAANADEAYAINHGAAGTGWVDEGKAFAVHAPTDSMNAASSKELSDIASAQAQVSLTGISSISPYDSFGNIKLG
ncbi:Ig-like domain-containing protein [Methylobacterium planeticum]|uniref:DUF5648 domain-containing protein n=1 Tax=Methylobacterium planeticum TaxID=2615211 RepID=A0A6N6MMR4_9HYPH|nr:Ig-like domain-containing protein [Methylobacterium planeticum]KAB1071204.1 hypothetical protein F6X51_20135 [Methylobacterium planeticum]